MGISVVIPVYNSAEILPDLIVRLVTLLARITSKHEVILVNDGSKDHSWDVIKKISQERSGVIGISLSKNYGQHNALLCGIREAHYDLIVTIDDDLQHPPEEIPKLLEKLNEGYDVVYGYPAHEQHGILRDFASQISKFTLQNAMGAENSSRLSAFRVFKTDLRQAFKDYAGVYVSIDVLLTWGTNKFGWVATSHQPRQSGVSNYTFFMLFSHAMNMFTGFSIIPLQLASLLGFGATLFGLLILIYVVGRVLHYGSKVPGFAFLASIISLFAGIQLFVLGIFGEYLARMHFRIIEKPSYVIREKNTQTRK